MEVIANRYYHGTDDGAEGLYASKQTKKNFVRFIMRTPPEYHELMKVRFSECSVKGTPINFLQRQETQNGDKVAEFEFDVIPYDNSLAKDVIAFHSVIIAPRDNHQDVLDILNEVGYKITKRQQSGCLSYTCQLYPPPERGTWTTIENPKPKFPICVLSFRRANESGRTHKTLTEMKLKHYLFVEPSQASEYKEWYNPEYCELVVCPEDFSKQTMGSTPVRNYILDWGYRGEFERVWMLDDNIKGYKRLYQGVKNTVVSSVVFTHVEDYVARYDNVGAVSHNFNPAITESNRRTCIVKNNKCYSSMLLKTDPEVRFRHKHQEDNLISMEYIHRGYTNLCFNSILYDKHTSGQDKGGNKEGVYKCEDGKTDGNGYKERFEYFQAIVKILFWEKKLELVDGKSIDDLVKRSTRHKSHEYHADVYYEFIKNHKINTHTKKVDYDRIIAFQQRQLWLFNGKHPNPPQ